MIDPVAPIKSLTEDKLGIAYFVTHIANLLLNQTDQECIVIGIYGKWGYGKSSLIYLVEEQIEEITQNSFKEHMKKATDEWCESIGSYNIIIPYLNMPLEYDSISFWSVLCTDIKYRKNSLINLAKKNLQSIPDNEKAPIIFQFNPWNISTMDKLISTYFHELSVAIEKEDKSENARDLVKRLELYSTFFMPFSYYPDTIISTTSKEIKNILKDASNSIKDEYKQVKHNLEDTKKEIEDHLKTLNRKVIVIIDDIDRLTQTEICQIFQLVKINANFKNLIYILLFDRDIVEKALDEISNNNGREYLEKIIQMPFIFPKIDQEIIDDFLNKELNEVLELYLEENFNEYRFKEIYNGGFSYFFKSIRDIKRYKNSLSCNLPLVYNEINIIDFLIIEVFRIYIPEVYTLIVENKEFFTNNTSSLLDKEKQQWKQRSSSIFKRIGKENEIVAKSLLTYLFPKKHEYFGEKYPGGASDEFQFHKERRICSKIFFDNYFMLGVPKSILSESEFEDIIKRLKNIEKEIELNNDKTFYPSKNITAFSEKKISKINDNSIAQIFESLRDRNFANQFLLKVHIRNISFSNPFLKKFFIVLFDISDYDNKETENIDIFMIRMLIEKYFKSMKYLDKKTLFEDIIKSSCGINSVMSILTISQDDAKNNYPLLFSKSDMEYFKNLWSDKIETLVICKELKGNYDFPRILDTYRAWGNEEKAKRYFENLIETQEGFLDCLKKLSYERSDGVQIDGFQKNITEIVYSILEEFLSIDEIKERINLLGNLSDEDSKFVESAKESLNRFISTKRTPNSKILP